METDTVFIIDQELNYKEAISFTAVEFTETACTSIIRQHPYDLETNADVFGSDTLLVLEGAANYGMRINQDTLLLFEQLFDGFTHFYVR